MFVTEDQYLGYTKNLFCIETALFCNPNEQTDLYQESAATNITEGRATDYAPLKKPNTYYKEVLVKTNKWSLVLTKLLDPTANLQQIQDRNYTLHYGNTIAKLLLW